LTVVRIPTNRPLLRRDAGTRAFVTGEAKWRAVVEAVQELTQAGRAVLIGTRSVEESERLGSLMREGRLSPVILNARQNREEAEIVARAGQPGRVTVATNMAGRGTDIQPHPAVLSAGGLHVILTEFHESPRIDRQLFGRGGRQGDPGSYQCFVGLEDEVFERFAGQPLLRIARSAADLAGRVSPIFIILLRSRSQAAAERLHARMRRDAVAEDLRLQRALAFAGKGE
jgi:preprotein translocase subunit SecA